MSVSLSVAVADTLGCKACELSEVRKLLVSQVRVTKVVDADFVDIGDDERCLWRWIGDALYCKQTAINAVTISCIYLTDNCFFSNFVSLTFFGNFADFILIIYI